MRKTILWRDSRPLHCALCLGPMLLMIAGVYLALGTEKQIFDFFTAYRLAHPDFTRVFQFFTDLANPALLAVYVGVLVYALRQKRRDLLRLALACLAAQLLVSLLLVRGLKIAIGRPRPMTEAAWTMFNLSYQHQSMPSGHSSEVLASALPLALWRARPLLSLGLGLYSALVGFSRIYLSMHHPSDIAGGMLTGLLAAWLVYRFGRIKRLARRAK